MGTLDSLAHKIGEQATSSNKVVDHLDAPMNNEGPGNGVSGGQVAISAVGDANEVNGGGDSSGVVCSVWGNQPHAPEGQDKTATSKLEKDLW